MIKLEKNIKEVFETFEDAFVVEKVLTELLIEKPDFSEIYVDDLESPKFIMGIYNKKEFTILGTIENLELIPKIEEIIEGYQLELGSVYSKNLLNTLLSNSALIKDFDDRVQLKFNEGVFKEFDLELVDFELKELDKELADKIPEEVDLDFNEAWSSGESFINNGGFGYALLKDNIIIATAWSYFISSKGVEIALATNGDYRNRGLGQYVASKMIKKALEKGLEPHWACHKENVSSEKLGLKLGFEFDLNYYWIYPSV